MMGRGRRRPLSGAKMPSAALRAGLKNNSGCLEQLQVVVVFAHARCECSLSVRAAEHDRVRGSLTP